MPEYARVFGASLPAALGWAGAGGGAKGGGRSKSLGTALREQLSDTVAVVKDLVLLLHDTTTAAQAAARQAGATAAAAAAAQAPQQAVPPASLAQPPPYTQPPQFDPDAASLLAHHYYQSAAAAAAAAAAASANGAPPPWWAAQAEWQASQQAAALAAHAQQQQYKVPPLPLQHASQLQLPAPRGHMHASLSNNVDGGGWEQSGRCGDTVVSSLRSLEDGGEHLGALEPRSRQGVPLDARLYVTWRSQSAPGLTMGQQHGSKAPPPPPTLRVEDLWDFFSRFGPVAFCDAHGVRHSAGASRPRGATLPGAGYAFVGFAAPQGVAAAASLLNVPSHSFRGAEIRVKLWRAQRASPATGGAHGVAAAHHPHAHSQQGGAQGRGSPPYSHQDAYSYGTGGNYSGYGDASAGEESPQRHRYSSLGGVAGTAGVQPYGQQSVGGAGGRSSDTLSELAQDLETHVEEDTEWDVTNGGGGAFRGLSLAQAAGGYELPELSGHNSGGSCASTAPLWERAGGSLDRSPAVSRFAPRAQHPGAQWSAPPNAAAVRHLLQHEHSGDEYVPPGARTELGTGSRPASAPPHDWAAPYTGAVGGGGGAIW